VGVFTTHDTEEILRTMDIARLDYAQLHANQSEACAERIGAERVIRVCFEIPKGGGLCAAYLLFDKPFDWRTLRLGGDAFALPYFVAGGVNAENVREVLSCAPPFAGVDLNSGVESAPGVKDAAKLEEVLREIGKLTS
jgi:phosphoribosylanthranilate isomerase